MRFRRPRTLVALLVLAAGAVVALLQLGGGSAPHPAAGRASASTSAKLPPPLRPHPRIVVGVAPGDVPPPAVESAGATGSSSTARAPSDAEVRSELADFRKHLASIGSAPRGPIPRVTSSGTAVAPTSAPGVVAAVIAAGNEIATKPYKWGGGHGAWRDSGYDCSGSVSFALAGAGLLDSPLDSTGFMHFGEAGPGRWITIYANGGHAFMVVAGLRFDTSGAQGGTRWQPAAARSYAGFEVRHPPGY